MKYRYTDHIPFYQKLNFNCPKSYKDGEGEGSCKGYKPGNQDYEANKKLKDEKQKGVDERRGKRAERLLAKSEKLQIENLKTVMDKVKTELASGKVSKQTYKEFRLAVKAVKAIKPANAENPEPTTNEVELPTAKKESTKKEEKDSDKSKERDSQPVTKIDQSSSVDLALKEANKVWPKFTDSQKRSLEHYTSLDYVPINSYLRTGKIKDSQSYSLSVEEVEETISNMDSVFNSVKLPSDLTVYRGIGIEALDDLKDKFVEGSEVEFPAFTSTTHNEETANTFTRGNHSVIMEIKLPKGSKALSIEDHSGFKKEYEVLLNRGMKFKVVSSKTKKIHKGHFSKTKITLEAIL